MENTINLEILAKWYKNHIKILGEEFATDLLPNIPRTKIAVRGNSHSDYSFTDFKYNINMLYQSHKYNIIFT